MRMDVRETVHQRPLVTRRSAVAQTIAIALARCGH